MVFYFKVIFEKKDYVFCYLNIERGNDMKKILFVISNLESGGCQNSLVSLLSSIDKDKYDISLMAFQYKGIFKKSIPSHIKILDEQPAWYPIKKSVCFYLKKFRFISMLRRIMYSVYNKVDHKTEKEFFRSWNIIKPIMLKTKETFDVAIAYGDGYPEYYICDCVNATKRVVWNHIDYETSDYNEKMDIIYTSKIDKIITISKECDKVYKKCIPNSQNKTMIIENIMSRELLLKKSKYSEDTSIITNFNGIKIISIGRLTPQKGYDILMPALKIIKEKGYKIKMFIIGVGEDEKNIKDCIKNNNLSSDVILLHEIANPYPYLKASDIYIQPSRFEGKPISLEEAKLLSLPIIVTNYPTVGNQIENMKNGLIVNMEPKSISEGLIFLIKNKSIRKEFIDYLDSHDTSNVDDVLRKFDILIKELCN